MPEAAAPQGAEAAAGPAPGPPQANDPASAGIERLASFRITYVAIFVFVVLSFQSIDVAEELLTSHYRSAIAAALRVNPANGPIIGQIEERVHGLVEGSPWTRLGDVRLDVVVLGADGRTPLYLVGRGIPPPPGLDPHRQFVDAIRLLPATAEVKVSVPIVSRLSAGIVIVYGAVLLTFLFLYNRSLLHRELSLLQTATEARDASAVRAQEIESELSRVQERLHKVEPAERESAEEIRRLSAERESLRRKLEGLAEREAELRARAARATELDEERRTLEDLLEEAVEDLSHKEGEIQELQDSLRRASRPAKGGRGRASEQLARRLRTLYKGLEVDDRAISDLVALGDENLRLRAEEALKRLCDDPDSASIRRKVGGLPPQLSIFELGFAGKGRIYYCRGRQQRYRVLAVGAKNTQKTDLEYLSRLQAD